MPGQSMAEASEIAAALEGVEAVYETTVPPDADGAGERALGYQRIYLLRDGREALTLASWAPDGEVVAIMRRMVVPGGTLPWDRISGALEEKYGPPDRTPREGLRGWGGAAGMQCFAMPYATPERQRFGGAGGRPDFRRGSALVLGMPRFPAEIEAMYAGCGEVMAYLEERPEEWGQAGFNVVLVDFGRLEAVRQALAPDGDTAGAFEIEF